MPSQSPRGLSSSRLALAGLAAGVFLALTGTADAAGPALANVAPDQPRALVQTVRTPCIDIVKRGGREVIVNTCAACLEVGVSRERRNNQAPTSRKYIVQARSSFKLPFKGPGRTRLGYARPCKGNGGIPNLANPQASVTDPANCVEIDKDQNSGAVFLVNTCGGCRSTGLERFNRAGQSLGRQVMLLGGKQRAVIPPRGAARVGLLGDSPCPS